MKDRGRADKESIRAGWAAIYERINNLLVTSGQEHPPVDIESVARHRGVVEIVEVENISEGLLRPTISGFRIEVKAGLPATRRRSTIAHEVGHTFFYDTSTLPPSKNIRWFRHAWSEEGACTAIGRRLLVPAFMLKASLDHSSIKPLTIRTIADLAQKFEVSSELISHRLQDESIGDAVFLFLRFHEPESRISIFPMLSVGVMRIRGICAFLYKNNRFLEAARTAAESGFGSWSTNHPELGALSVTYYRIGKEPLRVFALTRPA